MFACFMCLKKNEVHIGFLILYVVVLLISQVKRGHIEQCPFVENLTSGDSKELVPTTFY